MMKKNCAALILLALLGLALAGCGGLGPKAETTPDIAAAEPEVLYCREGYINTDGFVFREAGNVYYSVLSDVESRQLYVLREERFFDYARRNAYDMPQYQGCRFTVCSKAGEPLGQVEAFLPPEGRNRAFFGSVSFALPAEGDWRQSCVLLEMLADLGRFQILDMAGNVLVEQQVNLPDWAQDWQITRNHFLLTADCIAVNVEAGSAYSGQADYEYRQFEQAFLYDRQGNLLPAAHAYTCLWLTSADGAYFIAQYPGPQQQRLYALLDSSGRELIAGLRDIRAGGQSGLFVVEQGQYWGLMNAQGEWVHKESLFKDWED